jgi:hypothetical protein
MSKFWNIGLKNLESHKLGSLMGKGSGFFSHEEDPHLTWVMQATNTLTPDYLPIFQTI